MLCDVIVPSHLLKFTIYNQIPKHQVNMAKKRVETTGFRILMISKTVVTQTLLVMNHIYNKFTTLLNRMSIIKFQGFSHGHYPMKSIKAIPIKEESQFCTFFILTGAVKTKLLSHKILSESNTFDSNLCYLLFKDFK